MQLNTMLRYIDESALLSEMILFAMEEILILNSRWAMQNETVLVRICI